ncbi:hypothetical protein [Streptomyces sp. NPDC048669]|uniref:hypothetical protein n=1 Tax=Streptomyces sp. NPDC048669 TaxID=3155267 RepID=UPI00344AD264
MGIIGFATSMTALVILLMGLPHISRPTLAVFVLAAAPKVGWELRRPAPFFDFRGLAANGALTRAYLRHSRSPYCFSTMFGAGSGS